MTVSKKQFALKKIHSLLGVIPLGIFLAEHFIVNATVLFGLDKFAAIVHILETTPFIWVLEWVIIFIPLLIHGLLGVYFALQAKHNFKNYTYTSNIFFTVQRFSGLFLFVFLLYHIYSVKIHSMLTGATYASILQAQFSNPVLFFLYFIFCNFRFLPFNEWSLWICY
jgi:succinate dehydrogenase / fumarate reductase cytochrome b subunit